MFEWERTWMVSQWIGRMVRGANALAGRVADARWEQDVLLCRVGDSWHLATELQPA
jgi:hypothetical protein